MGTTYFIKREKGKYELLVPQDTKNPHEDISKWTPVLSEGNFSNFYYSLLDEVFPDISKDDRIMYDTTIAPMERDHTTPVFNLYKLINSARSTLLSAHEEAGESVTGLLEEHEEGMGMPTDTIEGLLEKIESAIRELSFE